MLDQLLQSFSDPHARHAIFVHIPIALGALGLVPLIILAASRFRSGPLKVLCIAWFVVASAGAAAAANAGDQAKDRVERTAAGAARSQALHQHEELGENGWLWPLIPAGLVAVTLLPRRRIAAGAGVLAMVAAAGVTGWVAYTGHTGGQLVYRYGVGVPSAGAGGGQYASEAPAPAHRDD